MLHPKSQLAVFQLVELLLVGQACILHRSGHLAGGKDRYVELGADHIRRGHIHRGLVAEVVAAVVLVIDAEGRSVRPAGQGDLLAGQLGVLLQELVVVVPVDVELFVQQGCGALHVEQVVDAFRQHDLDVIFQAELDTQRVVQHLERAARGIDGILQRSSLQFQLVGVGLLGHAHVHGILGNAQEFEHTYHILLQQPDGLFDHQRGKIEGLHLLGNILLGLVKIDVGHLAGDVGYLQRHDLGAAQREAARDVERGVGRHRDLHLSDIHLVSHHIGITGGCGHLRQHTGNRLPAAGLDFLDIYRRVGEGPVVIDGILLRFCEGKRDLFGSVLCKGAGCDQQGKHEQSRFLHYISHSKRILSAYEGAKILQKSHHQKRIVKLPKFRCIDIGWKSCYLCRVITLPKL